MGEASMRKWMRRARRALVRPVWVDELDGNGPSGTVLRPAEGSPQFRATALRMRREHRQQRRVRTFWDHGQMAYQRGPSKQVMLVEINRMWRRLRRA